MYYICSVNSFINFYSISYETEHKETPKGGNRRDCKGG